MISSPINKKRTGVIRPVLGRQPGGAVNCWGDLTAAAPFVPVSWYSGRNRGWLAGVLGMQLLGLVGESWMLANLPAEDVVFMQGIISAPKYATMIKGMAYEMLDGMEVEK